MDKQLIYNLDESELTDILATLGEPKYRLNQLLYGLYKKLDNDFDFFSNIPQSMRAHLSDNFDLNPISEIKTVHSKDHQTEKTLFSLYDNSQVETVLMRYKDRNSLCISTQVGCAMNCAFCATGQMGFTRNLTCGEIIAQVIHFERILRAKSANLTNIVYMGMGEPFLNWDHTIKSIKLLTDPKFLNFGARRITISTVGITPKIKLFTDLFSQVNLAVSLHTSNDKLRSELVPANRIYPLKGVIDACREYTKKTHRRISFEYALINNINDSVDQAEELVLLIKGMLCHVNLIALNPSKKYPLQGSSREKVNQFQETLLKHGIPCTVRLRRGIEINAGCGQLASAQITE